MTGKPNPSASSSLLVTIGFLASLGLFVVLLTFGIRQVSHIHANVHQIVNTHNTKDHLTQAMYHAARERVLYLFTMANTEDPFDRDELFLRFNANGGRFARARLALLDMELTPEEQDILDTQGRYTSVAVPLQNRIVELIDQEQLAAARELLSGEALDAQNAVLDQLNRLTRLQRSRADKTLAETTRQHDYARALMIWLGIAATVLGLLIAALIIRRVRRAEHGLTELNATLEQRVAERTRALEDANGELRDTVSTLQDTQRQLVQSEKMASLGNLVAGISHEINTPVGIAVTAGSNIKERAGELGRDFNSGKLTRSGMGEALANIDHGCDILLSNLDRAAGLIRSFKQVAVDQTSDESRRFNLHDYCDEILTSLHPRLKHRPIEVNNRCAPDIVVFTNPGALYQVLSNLVLNSLAHGFDDDQQGRIVIEAHAEDGQAVIDYRDNGKGIPREHLDRIFEPFFTTKRGQGGSGLGLNIVYNLVTSTLQGTITPSVPEEGGARFTIQFPDLQQETNRARTG